MLRLLSCLSRVRDEFQSVRSYDMLHVVDCFCEGTALPEIQRDFSTLKQRGDLVEMLDVSLGFFGKIVMSLRYTMTYCHLTLARVISVAL